jgi:hypothetical protein
MWRGDVPKLELKQKNADSKYIGLQKLLEHVFHLYDTVHATFDLRATGEWGWAIRVIWGDSGYKGGGQFLTSSQFC